ncbi:ribonuclease III [Polychaeton citri CBS 116435]|uniref:Ribonuclease III n=1 Tax=Polychaeton citri CBS 116435 TaxID=1314669 RepID=A0A9P4Q1C3_9PEZI|nr:ribonuclease III [Polychaeton citri CBS 116435]
MSHPLSETQSFPSRTSSSSRKRHHEHTDRHPDFSGKRPRREDGSMTSSRIKHDYMPEKHANDKRLHEFIENGPPKPSISFEEAVKRLPTPIPSPSTVTTLCFSSNEATVDAISKQDLPPLPAILSPHLASAPFTHKSQASASHSRSVAVDDVSYERLEFLGDAYIELIASRLIFHRYSWLPAGRQSQLRELLVKNETLAGYSLWYGFHKRLQLHDLDRMKEGSKIKGNKGIIKIYGDVFEAYVAAVILSDPHNGFANAEQWLTALWAAKVLDAIDRDEVKATRPSTVSTDALAKQAPTPRSQAGDAVPGFDPDAKVELQKRILAQDVRLDYQAFQSSIELKGDQLGQNKHFIAVYLTGYGYEKKELGRGEGKSKLEAGNRAAQQAMYGESKATVDECAEILLRKKEEARLRRAAENDRARIESGKWDGRMNGVAEGSK